MSNEQLIADLKAAKARLQERGRCNSGPWNDQGNECLVVGIARAIGADYAKAIVEVEGTAAFNNRQDAVTQALTQALGIDKTLWLTTMGGGMVRFNENPNTTDQDVWDLFDKALAEAGGLG